jgi:hypothetical protein
MLNSLQYLLLITISEYDRYRVSKKIGAYSLAAMARPDTVSKAHQSGIWMGTQ